MKERKRRNKKILGIINVVVIVYIFTLAIGYSFFRETLKISGNVSTEKPKECPFELQELTYQLYNDSQTNIMFNKYYAEYSSFRWNDIDLVQEDEIYESGLAMLGYLLVSVDAFPFDYYDKQGNTLSIYSSLNSLYPFDDENMLSFGMAQYEKNFYSVLSRPIYFVFKNVTAYTLDRFTISIDDKNNPFISHVTNDPLELLDIRWAKISDLGQIVDVIETDYASLLDYYDLPVSWVYGDGFDDQLIKSVFKESDMTIIDTDVDDSYYVLDEFQDGRLIEFSTTPIEPDQYLVLGIRFPNTLYSDWNVWDETSNYNVNNVIKEPDGIAFKFWPSDFDEKSAFHVRFGFDSFDNKFNYIQEELRWSASREALKDFYNRPNFYQKPIDWWE